MMRKKVADVRKVTEFIQKGADSIDIEFDLQKIEKNCYQKKCLP